eukprot:RCo021077
MDQKAQQFQALTNADANQAAFFLSSCNGNLEEALEMFFSGGGGAAAAAAASAPPQPPPPRPATVPAAPQRPSSAAAQPKPKPASKAPASRMRTLADLGRDSEPSEESPDDKDGVSSYVGGASSGLAVQQPGRKKNPEEAARELLEKAKEKGAVNYEEYRKGSEAPFSGTGMRLGQVPSSSEGARPQKDARGRQKREVAINFWTDGFSVDDGPLRSMDDPAGKQFLDAISRNEIPPELRQQLAAELDPAAGPPEVIVHLVE